MGHAHFLVFLITTLWAVAAVAQTTIRPLSTDRPDRTESPYSAPKGWGQFESDIVSRGTLEIGDQTITSTYFTSFNVKYGVMQQLDLQFVFSPWLRVHTEGPGVEQTNTDTGQAGLRAKLNLAGNDGGRAAVALLPFVFVPTHGGGVLDSATWGMLVPVSVSVTENVSFASMLGAQRVNNDTWWVIGSASLGTAITENLGGFLESYVARAGLESSVPDDVTVDAGLVFAHEDRWAIDTGVYYGITDDTERWRVFVGGSIRFPVR